MFRHLKNDLPAGIVVFLVAVPLCLGIALASGAPLFSGIIAGVVGGIVVSLASGSQLGVSGPAAGLAVIVLTSIQALGGSFSAFLLAVVIAGVLQIVLGYLKAGVIGYYFPSSVIKGMLSAIGILIILKQIPHAMGYDKDYEGDLTFLQSNGENTFSAITTALSKITLGPLVVTLVSLAILVLWEVFLTKRHKIFQLVQGPLIAVAASIVLTMVFNTMVPDLAIRPDQMVSLPVASDIHSFFGQFAAPDFTQITNPTVWTIAVTLALVASLETLLCVEATDKLDPQKRVTPTNRELKAQGLGNLISGLIGGLPITQVIVRSSANIQSGGKTKAAALIHGLLLLISVVSIPFVLNMIPLASLAAILFVVGYKLAKPMLFKSMYKLGWDQFVPFVVTIVAIVFTDLLKGIGIGLAVSFFYVLLKNYKVPYFFQKEKHTQGEAIRIVLSEHVSFLNKASILLTLNHLPENSEVIIDGSKSAYIDHDVREVIEEFKINAATKNIKVHLLNIEEKVIVQPNIKTIINENTHKRNTAVAYPD
jgi:MFS superfamily sulfate permease-like transporter